MADGRKFRLGVSDSGNNRVQQFSTTNGSFIASFGSSGSEVGQFNTPKGLTYDSSGTLYIVDWGNNRIALAEGSLIEEVTGINGTGLGQLNGPMNISVDERAVYVADTGNNRAQSFNARNPLGIDVSTLRFIVSTNLNQPCAIAATGDLLNETFYVADTGNNRVLFYQIAADGPLSIWSSMTNSVSAGDISSALSCFSIQTQDDYRDLFLAVGTGNTISTINQIGTLAPIYVYDDQAQYTFTQIINGETITLPVDFVKENGVWKILEF